MFALRLLFFSLLLMANPIASYDFLKFSTFRTRLGRAPCFALTALDVSGNF